MNPLNMLAGYKTYITAAVGFVVAIGALLGVQAVPGVELSTDVAFNMLWEALAIVFVRKAVS